jgi:hypothetical protein
MIPDKLVKGKIEVGSGRSIKGRGGMETIPGFGFGAGKYYQIWDGADQGWPVEAGARGRRVGGRGAAGVRDGMLAPCDGPGEAIRSYPFPIPALL